MGVGKNGRHLETEALAFIRRNRPARLVTLVLRYARVVRERPSVPPRPLAGPADADAALR